MIKLLTILLSFGLATPPPTPNNPLQALRWSHRPLVILAPTRDDPALRMQREQYTARLNDAQEREMILLALWPGGGTLDDQPLSATQAQIARDALGATDRFVVLLIGKDGQIKDRRDAPTDLQSFFDLIDTMPMRRREMQRRIPH